MSGEVDLTFALLLAGLTQVKAGKLKAIGVTGKKRSQVLPNVPTIGETLPGYNVEAWARLTGARENAGGNRQFPQ